jgi:hypothetical protein
MLQVGLTWCERVYTCEEMLEWNPLATTPGRADIGS